MKFLKFLFIPLLLIPIFILTLTSCQDSTPTIVLNVYNWGEYISDGAEGALNSNKEFEKYCAEKFKDFNVKVNYTTYSDNEVMYTKLKSGAGSYDIVIPSDYMIQQMIAENMLLEFDVSELPNYKYIADEFKNPYYDPSASYSVPYTYGMIGIIYNTKLVDEKDYESKSWNLLWNEAYKGKILQFNNPRDAFGTAMYRDGIDVNTTNKAEWDIALEALIQQKPLIQAYVSDEIFNKMVTASAAIAPYYAGDYITMAEKNSDLAFYYPEEGVNYFMDAMCIPKDSKYPEIAKEYINFMLSEEIAVANSVYIGYASPNKLIYDKDTGYVNPDYLEEMGEDAISILYETSPSAINAEYEAKIDGTACYKAYPNEETKVYVNTLWESLKTENSTELWVHISTAIIVGTVVILTSYSIYIKKARSRDYRLRDKAKAKKNINNEGLRL